MTKQRETSKEALSDQKDIFLVTSPEEVLLRPAGTVLPSDTVFRAW